MIFLKISFFLDTCFNIIYDIYNNLKSQGGDVNKKFLYPIIFLILVLIAGYNLVSEVFLDYIWFNSYNQKDVFFTLFFSEFNVHTAFSIIFFFIFIFNFLILRYIGNNGIFFSKNLLDRIQLPIFSNSKKAAFFIIFIGSIFLSYFMGSIASSFWKEILMFFNQVPFESAANDPIFSKNPSFYVFSLPFYNFLYGWLLGSFIIILLFSTFFHVINGGITVKYGKFSLSAFTRSHISVILAILAIIYGAGYRLSSFDLLLKAGDKFYGAGYTDVSSRLFAYNICMGLSFAAAILLLINIFKRSYKLIVSVIVVLIPIYFILATVVPGLQQRFIVIPNELAKERPYIKNNIEFTRNAYGVNQVKVSNFKNTTNLTSQDIDDNIDTLRNIRLWDWKPLQQTYRQLQELKPYYSFLDVDIDRYTIEDKTFAVNISARELLTNKLSTQSRTWINKHLVYTHGYGFVMSRVDKVTPEGLPEMIVKNIPPKSELDLSIERPEIYYGEHNNDYIFTNTNIDSGEFDYPFGEKNRYTRYEGSGGIKIGSFFKKLLFSFALKDINILITGNITPESKILYKRNIVDIVQTLSPFLVFDSDPYLVFEDGRLFWIIDAYTTSDNYPYSTPVIFRNKRINYIRNSVKIVIDAYNGDASYYIIDKNDSVINTYAKIFPGLFKDFSEMPIYLKKHIRYPEKLFNIQSSILLKYHMQDVNVFYNNEDLWSIPGQIYESSKEIMESNYLITKLPEEENAEFILMLPFTPTRKDNMTAFLAARCDYANYGELILYKLPKESLTYGPMQIEARINQDANISKQLTLWSQKGSKVIRGNMIVLPIKNSLLFIEPLYLKAESSEMPELKRVILSFADKIYMAENLESALEMMFANTNTNDYFISKGSSSSSTPDNIKNNISKAYNIYLNAEKYLKEGDFEKYGSEIKKLKTILQKLNNTK